ncbi:unnamed protein product [Onchocerca ochengi]|uniref:Uncharacterized protein n=1 Tax=Onchocerca ochengi TaxID=42157 RepID=A0A182ELL2_ONCOC|nr:unnamed protein product [Onchocerca ochengi]
MSASRHGAPGPPTTSTKTPPTAKKKSKISKKLAIKKERLVPMNDLPRDAPPVECPPIYEVPINAQFNQYQLTKDIEHCYVTMKPLKKHRLSITKRYFGKINRGLMRLMPEKSAKANSEAIGSEYIVDLTTVAVSCDDVRRRLIFKFKKESRDIGPVNKNEYDSFKEMIQKHRNYRQSIYRNKKENINELIPANAFQSDSSPTVARLATLEQDTDTGKSREDFRGAQKSEDEASTSEDSDDKLEIAIPYNNQAITDAIQKEAVKEKIAEEKKGIKLKEKKVLEKNKVYLTEEFVEKKEEKPERLVEMGEPEKVQPRKRRDQLPKPSVASEELGFRQLMAIIARRLPIPITYFEPLTTLQVLCEELRYSGQTLGRALSAYDPVDRIAYVTAFAVSSYSGMICRKQKPFSPLLGETFDYVSNEGWKYHAEQVGTI